MRTHAIHPHALPRITYRVRLPTPLCLKPHALRQPTLVTSCCHAPPPIGYLYIVHRGIALYGGKVLTTGKVWGEDMILFNMSLQRTWCARAMNYLEVLMLSRDRLVLIYDQFPATEKIIKRQAMFLALRRYIIAAATKLVEKGQAKGSFTRKKSFSLDAALTAASSRAMSMGEQSMSHAALSCSQATLQRSSSVETLPVASTPAVGHDDQTTAKLLGEMASVKNEVAELKGMVALLLSRGGGDASEPPTN